MTYDKLVNNLRICSRCDFGQNCNGCTQDSDDAFCCDKLLHEAADAIEKLNILAENGEATYEIMVRQTSYIEELKQKIPRWIPVTEQLPLLNTPVLATDGIEVDISWMYGVPPRWITNYTAINEDKLTHWMPLPQTPKDGE